RVHLASIGHPLLGDDVYGGGFKTKANQLADDARAALDALGRQALHAYLLGIEHPSQCTNLEFRSELPDDLLRLRHSLGAQGTRVCQKAQADQGFRCTGGGQGEVTPIPFSFDPVCPVMWRLRSAFGVAENWAPGAGGAAVRFARRCTGG